MTRTSWKTIRSILGKSMTRLDSNDPQSVAWFDFQWKLIVGRDLAAVTQVNKFSSKTLFVIVSSEAWFSALQSLREKIITKINQRAGSVLVNRIVFQEGLVIGPTIKNPPIEEKRYSLEQNKIKETEAVVKDESMENILDRISDKLRVVLPAVILLLISNCTTLPMDRVSKNIDLSNSYAVKAVDKLSGKQTKKNIQDPRAYYHYLMALQAIREHQFEQASENFHGVIKFNSNDSKFYHQLAINLIRSGKIKDAYKALEESLRHFPDNPELNMMIGDILAGREEFERALNHYQRVIQAQSSLARAYLLSGAIYEVLKQYDLAADMYGQVIQVESGNPLGHHYLARMNILTGKLEDAIKHLNQALELRPNLLQSREFLAWSLGAQGKKDEAKKQYKILLKLDPLNQRIPELINSMKDSILPMDVGSGRYRLAVEEVLGSPDVHTKIGAVYYEQGLYLKALDEFQLLRAKKQKKEVLMVLGRVYEILGRIDRAIQEISALKKIEPQSVDLMIYLARLHSMNKQPEETIRLIETAIKIDQGNDTLYHSLALAYIGVDRLDQAINAMQKAIAIDKNKDSYYFELGALLERTGEFELAIKNIKRSIQLNPMHSNAHNFLGYIYAIQGKYLDKALGHLNKALSIQPRNGYFLDSLSWIYFKKGEPTRALSELRKAMVYTFPDPVLYSHLGDIHFSLKNYIEAGKAWKTSLILTLKNIGDVDSELPDPKELEKKIQKVEGFLSNN